MFSLRLIIFSSLMFLSLTGSSLAQRPGPEFWRRVSCEPFEPRTKLEGFEERHAALIVKGFNQIATVEVNGVRVDALELRDLGNSTRASGIVIALREVAERPRENRAFIDYEEINPLLNNLDAVARVNETMTKFVSFEAHYRTLGDLEVRVFRQTSRGTAVTISTGVCDQVTQSLTLDELAKFRSLIVEAKDKLDAAK
jgi:hypothetical protein